MKAFIAICVALLAFVSVNGDQAADQKAMIAKITAQYANLTNEEIKVSTAANVKAIENIMDAAIKKYVKEDLTLVATIDLNVIHYVNTGLPNLFVIMDKDADAKLKHVNYVQLGVISEVIKALAQAEDKRRAANPIKVGDTEENLMKKYKEKYTEMLDLLKWTVEQEKKKKELAVWVGVHQRIYDFMAPHLKEIEEAVEHLPKASRAKNLQVMLDDLILMFKAVDTRQKTFSAKFTEKVHEIYTNVKQFFAKIF